MKKKLTKAKILAAPLHRDRSIPATYSVTIKERETQWQWLNLPLNYPTATNYTVIYQTRISTYR